MIKNDVPGDVFRGETGVREPDANGDDGNLQLCKKTGGNSRETTRRGLGGLAGFERASR